MFKFRRVVGYALTLALLLTLQTAALSSAATPPRAQQQLLTITLGGSTTPQAGATGTDVGVQTPEIPAIFGSLAAKAPTRGKVTVNRSLSRRPSASSLPKASAKVPKSKSLNLDESNPQLLTSFDGLNHRQQRLANGGNQFSLEPPDQGMCVGNGKVMEVVNDVLRVFDVSGNALTGVIDLNTFYGYAAQFNRTTGAQGPFVTDPSCLFDADTQRWFVDVLTLDVDPSTGNFLGTNHLDLAVSQSSDPTGAFNIYRIPVQDDGTQGTPNHGCSFGPCLGDFPHIGVDKNAVILTTNEYSLFGPEFHAAQVYALSKQASVKGASSITVANFDTFGTVAGRPGFTLWPANGPAGVFESAAHGTEYFLSSTAADEVNCPTFNCTGGGTSTNVVLWALTNTASLNSSTPALALNYRGLNSELYAIPPTSDQKPGDYPLGQCLNMPSCSTFLIGAPDPFTEVESHLDSSDTRFLTTWFANGRLFGALGTLVNVGGGYKAGIAYFIVNPDVEVQHGTVQLTGRIEKQGYVALANNNLTYPTIATKPNGQGIMGFTLVGADHFPSAGYASLSRDEGVGMLHVGAEGLGPSDGFTSYVAFVGNPPRTRWGDYGAAVSDGNTIWIANEYIGQTCTLAQYTSAPFGSCGGTRSTLANWGTRISQVQP